jgi:TonB family protein
MPLSRMSFGGTLIILLSALSPALASAQEGRRAGVAVLDFGATEAGRRVSEHFARTLAGTGAAGGLRLALLDRGLARSAARGGGYAGSLNLTLREARDLGAAVGCDFFLTGDAQVIRRSASERPVYYEAYASVFVVSARTGRLVSWSRAFAEENAPGPAEAALLAQLDARTAARVLSSIADAVRDEESESAARAAGRAEDDDAVLDLTAEGAAGARGDVREPAPYRRLRPAYTEAAALAEAEATVDVIAEIGADGRVGRVEVVRWAGFGLDEEVVSTVRRMNFRPATVGGEPRPSRVLLRYNFRRPARKQD